MTDYGKRASGWMAAALVLAFSGLALADSSASLGLFASAESGSGGSGGFFDGFFAFFANVGASIQSAFSGGASASNETGRAFGFAMATDAFASHDVYAAAAQGEESSGGEAGIFGGLFASGSARGSGAAQSSASGAASSGWVWAGGASSSGAAAESSGEFFGGLDGSARGAAAASGSAGGFMNRSAASGSAAGMLGLGIG